MNIQFIKEEFMPENFMMKNLYTFNFGLNKFRLENHHLQDEDLIELLKEEFGFALRKYLKDNRNEKSALNSCINSEINEKFYGEIAISSSAESKELTREEFEANKPGIIWLNIKTNKIIFKDEK